MSGKPRTVVVQGNPSVGKTSLALAFTTGKLSDAPSPFLRDWRPPATHLAHPSPTTAVRFEVGSDTRVEQLLYSRSPFDRLPDVPKNHTWAFSQLHPGAVVALVFSLVDAASLAEVRSWWLPVLREAVRAKRMEMPRVVLVGCKLDLVDHPATLARLQRAGQAPVTHKQALEFVAAERLHSYAPFSAKWHNDHSHDSFGDALLNTLDHATKHQHLPQRLRPHATALPPTTWRQSASRLVLRALGRAPVPGEDDAVPGENGVVPEIPEPQWLAGMRDREWKKDARVALLMSRHPRVGKECDAGLRDLPDELWECVFRHLRRL